MYRAKITQSAKANATQYAKDIIQSFGISSGSINATNIGNISSNSTAQIQNNINQFCTNIATNINTFTCRNVDGLYGDYVAQDSITDSTVNCALSDNIINSTVQHMSATTDQYASATENDALALGALGAFMIYLAYIANTVIIGSGYINLILCLFALGLIAVVGMILVYYKHHKPNNRPPDDRCADCTKFSAQKDCEQSACKWTGADNATTSDKDYPSLSPLCVCNSTDTNCDNQCYLKTDPKSCKKANCGWDANNKICTGDPKHCHPKDFD